jgi:hypothetical protein
MEKGGNMQASKIFCSGSITVMHGKQTRNTLLPFWKVYSNFSYAVWKQNRKILQYYRYFSNDIKNWRLHSYHDTNITALSCWICSRSLRAKPLVVALEFRSLLYAIHQISSFQSHMQKVQNTYIPVWTNKACVTQPYSPTNTALSNDIFR